MKFVFCDLETTGLDPQKCCILEIGVKIIEPVSINTITEYTSVVRPVLGWAEHAESVAMDMHQKSGLIEKAARSPRHLEQVQDQVLEMLPDGEDLYLAGNSVHFDRSFLAVHMPIFLSKLHHRQLDVTSLRLGIWASMGQDPLTWKKERRHTAMEDLEETMKEFKHYVQNNLS